MQKSLKSRQEENQNKAGGGNVEARIQLLRWKYPETQKPDD